MSAPRRVSEEQWDEHELVHMFTEILLQARERSHSPANPPRSASQILSESIRNANIEPNWADLILPNGRSLNSCVAAFQQYAQSSSQPAPAASPAFALPGTEPTSRKRPYPPDTFTPIGRVLKPKPATFPVGEPSRLSMSTQGSFPLSPLAEPAPSLGEPRKKRGRPTKKEQEERRRRMELGAQGLLSSDIAQGAPPSLALQMAGPSTHPAGPLAIASTPQPPPQEESTNSGSSSGKKRRGRPPRPAPAEPAPPFPIHTTTAYEFPLQPSSTRDRRASVSTRSETTVRTQASTAPESTTAGATAGEQSEDSRRTIRPRIWE